MNNTFREPCKACTLLTKTENQYRRYISAMSHEIRNPLTLISSSLQLLEKECPSVTKSQLWPQVQDDLQYTIRFLKEVSSLNHSSRLNTTAIPAAEFFSQLAAAVSPLMQSRTIRLEILCEQADLIIFADPLRLREALMNLLLNAADALCSREAGRQIRLCAKEEGQTLILHVRDNASGIPDAYLDTLFEPFVTHKANGTGLGLAIVREIVKHHGGSVSVNTCASGPDTYTDFCIRLPQKTVAPDCSPFRPELHTEACSASVRPA